MSKNYLEDDELRAYNDQVCFNDQYNVSNHVIDLFRDRLENARKKIEALE